MLGQDELQKRFSPQMLTPGGLAQLEYMRGIFLDLATSIDHLIPDGREKSVALTELQSSSMWAIKAICCDPKFWVKDPEIAGKITFEDGGETLLVRNKDGKYEPLGCEE